jgi:hypothetical protein
LESADGRGLRASGAGDDRCRACGVLARRKQHDGPSTIATSRA